MIAILLTSGAAFLVAFAATPLIRRLAFSRDFVDRPDGRRKMQKAPVALGGGSAVMLGLMAGVGLLAAGFSWFDIPWIRSRAPLAGMGVAAVLLCIVGLVDDRYQIRGRTKLFWQILAGALVVFAGPLMFAVFGGDKAPGLFVERMTLFGHEFSLGEAGSLLALFWLLGSINSFNLIDGVDGLCTSVGIVFSITLAAIAFMTGNTLDGVVALILAGALLGFLRYNFAPATIYLGDAGSMIIGLVLGTLALRCSTKGAATVAFSAPLAVWTIPILDSLAAIARRKLTGRSIYSTDRGHIHHRLLKQGLSTRQAVLLIVGLCSITSLGAILGIYFQKEWIGFAVVFLVLGSLIGTRVFGHVELMLLNSSLLGIGRTIVAIPSGEGKASHSSHQLQGSLQWEEKIWNALVESAERFDLIRLRLNLYLPHLHEDFYATWKRPSAAHTNKVWRIDLPLVVDGMTIGHLHVVGYRDPCAASAQLTSFLDFLEPLEAQVHELLSIPAPGKMARPVEAPVSAGAKAIVEEGANGVAALSPIGTVAQSGATSNAPSGSLATALTVKTSSEAPLDAGAKLAAANL